MKKLTEPIDCIIPIKEIKGEDWFNEFYSSNIPTAWSKEAVIRKLHNKILEIVPPRKYLKILDVGSGMAFVGKHYIDAGSEYYGIDFSSKAIELAQKRTDYCRFFHMDIETQEFHDFLQQRGPFDVAISMQTLEHVGDDLLAASTILQHCPKFVFSVPENQKDFSHNVHLREYTKDSVMKRFGDFSDVVAFTTINNRMICELRR